MNAFLLISSAMLAGADPVITSKPVANAPVVSAPIAGGTVYGAPGHGAPISSAPWGGGQGSCCGSSGSGGCGGDCGCASSCGCGGGGFFGKMKGMFHRNKGCGCDDGCGCGQQVASGCGCGQQVVSSCDCGCASSCGCGGGGFFGKMKGLFHRNKGCGCDDGCGGGCDGCGGGAYGGVGSSGAVISTPGTMAPVGEPIKAPKDATPGNKLPTGTKKKTGSSTSAIPEVTPLPPISAQGFGTSNNANPF